MLQQLFQQLVRFILYSNTWVAISFATLVFGIAHYNTYSRTALFSSVAFAGTLSAYQLHRFLRIHQYKYHISTNPRLTWMLSHKWILRFIFFLATSYTILIGYPFIDNSTQLTLILVSGIIVGLYALPLRNTMLGIRQLPFVKNIAISLVWTFGATLPFWSAHNQPETWILLVLFLATFIQIIPFDLRDLPVDAPQMRTIPQLLGVFGSRVFASTVVLGLTILLSSQLGFHPMLLFYLISALLGFWIPISPNNLLFLEFMWDFPLFLLGIYFWLM